jgi:NACalpha-BTF3-like transcription factor
LAKKKRLQQKKENKKVTDEKIPEENIELIIEETSNTASENNDEVL